VLFRSVVSTGIGIGASPAAAARSAACVGYIDFFTWIQRNFMAAYDAHNQADMDFWLRVYEDAIAGAEAAC